MARRLMWWSTGAASAVCAALALSEDCNTIVLRCETSNEDPDNYRFEGDVMRRLNCSVELLKSKTHTSVRDVWEKRRYMAGISGAPCTLEMKVIPRLDYQRPDDTHFFGYTADARDIDRFNLLQQNYPEMTVRAPLIEKGIDKVATLAMVQGWGIKLPRTYAMGFHNANCMGTGCSKATSPDYWSLYRHHFPQSFAETAAYARSIGARLSRINDVRVFIDDIPADWPMTNPIVPSCDFLCHIAELDLAATT